MMAMGRFVRCSWMAATLWFVAMAPCTAEPLSSQHPLYYRAAFADEAYVATIRDWQGDQRDVRVVIEVQVPVAGPLLPGQTIAVDWHGSSIGMMLLRSDMLGRSGLFLLETAAGGPPRIVEGGTGAVPHDAALVDIQTCASWDPRLEPRQPARRMADAVAALLIAVYEACPAEQDLDVLYARLTGLAGRYENLRRMGAIRDGTDDALRVDHEASEVALAFLRGQSRSEDRAHRTRSVIALLRWADRGALRRFDEIWRDYDDEGLGVVLNTVPYAVLDPGPGDEILIRWACEPPKYGFLWIALRALSSRPNRETIGLFAPWLDSEKSYEMNAAVSAFGQFVKDYAPGSVQRSGRHWRYWTGEAWRQLHVRTDDPGRAAFWRAWWAVHGHEFPAP